MTEEAARLEVLSALQDELRYLLNRWDPIGVYDEALDFPPDEYDCLLGPLLTRLGRHDSRAELSEYLWREIEGRLGLGTDGFADRLLAWYSQESEVLAAGGLRASAASRAAHQRLRPQGTQGRLLSAAVGIRPSTRS